jgi:hypothetical protein
MVENGNRPDLAIEAGRQVACPNVPLLPREGFLANADIAGLLAAGAALFIAIDDVFHERSAHAVRAAT